MVNIFFIYPDIQATAKTLDRERLGKQRVEAKQIIDVLERYDQGVDISKMGWANHPALKSWMGFTNPLKVYFNVIVREWIHRGYVNNMPLYAVDESLYKIVPCHFDGHKLIFEQAFDQYSFPFWVSFPPFYLSHQASLCRKNPSYYKFLLRNELNEYLNNGYLWPCNVPMEAYNDWNFSYHEPLACGCPAVFRIPQFDVLRWLANPSINPTTGRRISDKSKIHADYSEAMQGHRICVLNGVLYVYEKEYCTLENLPEAIVFLQNYYSIHAHPTPCELVYQLANV